MDELDHEIKSLTEEEHEELENQNNPTKKPEQIQNTISPIDEYRIHGKFPWQMIVQILLIIATTAQAIIIITTTTNYCRCQERVLYEHLISESDKEDPDYPRTAYLYSVEQLTNHLKTSLDNYFDLEDNSLESFYYDIPEKTLSHIEMTITYNETDLSKINLSIPIRTSYNVSAENLGPFDNSYNENEIKEYIKWIKEFKLKYAFNTYVPIYFQEHRECFGWEVFQTYDLTFRAHFKVELDIRRDTCNDKTELTYWEIFLARLAWIHVAIIILCIINEIQTLFVLYQNLIEHWINEEEKKKKDKFKLKEDTEKNDISYKNKFSKWTAFNLLGNLIQVISGVVGLLDLENKYQVTGILVGFGSMFSFINICYYLDFNKSYSTLYATLQRALPVTFRFFTGLLPVFAGFVFFGICVFWRSERFFGISSTSLALFSVTFGDSIYDILRDLTNANFFMGQIYLYGFCVFFGVCIANIFMGIIQRAYVSAKMRTHLHWIFKYIRDDPNVGRIVGYHRNIRFSREKNIKVEQIKATFDERIEFFRKNVLVCQKQLDIINDIKSLKVKKQLLKEYMKYLNQMKVINEMSLNVTDEYKH